eukprot:6630820-Alexandrium_andersonii.AAC.1
MTKGRQKARDREYAQRSGRRNARARAPMHAQLPYRGVGRGKAIPMGTTLEGFEVWARAKCGAGPR